MPFFGQFANECTEACSANSGVLIVYTRFREILFLFRDRNTACLSE